MSSIKSRNLGHKAGARGGMRTITIPNLASADVTAGVMAFIADQPYRVARVDWVHQVVAGQAGTAQLQRCQGTEDQEAGDDLLTAIDLTATALTVINATLTTTLADLELATGDRLMVTLASGAATSLVGGCMVVTLLPLYDKLYWKSF